MKHVDMQSVQELVDTIRICELAVSKLKTRPPANMTYEEVTKHIEFLNNRGLKALTAYYRYTVELFSDKDETERGEVA